MDEMDLAARQKLASQIKAHRDALDAVESHLGDLHGRVGKLAISCGLSQLPDLDETGHAERGEEPARARDEPSSTLLADQNEIDALEPVARDYTYIEGARTRLHQLREARRPDIIQARELRAEVDADTQLLERLEASLPVLARAFALDVDRDSAFLNDLEEYALRHGTSALKDAVEALTSSSELTPTQRRDARAGLLYLLRRVTTTLVQFGTVDRGLLMVEARFTTWLEDLRRIDQALDDAAADLDDAARKRFSELVAVVAVALAVPALVAAVFGANVDAFRNDHEAPFVAMLVVMGAATVVGLSILAVFEGTLRRSQNPDPQPSERWPDRFLTSSFVALVVAALVIGSLKRPLGLAGQMEVTACLIAAFAAVGAYLWRQTGVRPSTAVVGRKPADIPPEKALAESLDTLRRPADLTVLIWAARTHGEKTPVDEDTPN